MAQVQKTPGQDMVGRIVMAGVAIGLIGFLVWSLATHGTASVIPSLP